MKVTTNGTGMKYELMSVLSLVTDDVVPRSPTSFDTSSSSSSSSLVNSHLVLHTSHHATGNQWYCFNDYCIHASSIHDALLFTEEWKAPICLVYCCRDIPDDNLLALLNAPCRPIPPPFYSPVSLGAPDAPMTFRILPMDRLPVKGELVSIDCEFIAMSCEQVSKITIIIFSFFLYFLIR